MSRYYVFRFFQSSNLQTELFKDNGTVNQLQRLFDDVNSNKKVALQIDVKKHLLIKIASLSDAIVICKFCREKEIVKYDYNEKQEDIVEIVEANYPYIIIIINKNSQLIFIEHKSSVYPKIDEAKKVFESFMHMYSIQFNGHVSLDEITKTSNFWDNINSADAIYEIQIRLNAPNLFGSAITTNELVTTIKEEFNNDETILTVRSEKGNLIAKPDILNDPIRYASAGGGSWLTKILKRGNTRKSTISSKRNIKVIDLQNMEGELDENAKGNIISELDSVDDIFTKDI
jgi:hypothetical protein